MDDYNEMMDQYEKDRREQTHTWICKDAVLGELDTLLGIVDGDQPETMIINMIASSINRLPAHRFSLMDEIKEQDMTGELPYEQ